jgi:hypothetical protein
LEVKECDGWPDKAKKKEQRDEQTMSKQKKEQTCKGAKRNIFRQKRERQKHRKHMLFRQKGLLVLLREEDVGVEEEEGTELD